jgi:hypothetical protein
MMSGNGYIRDFGDPAQDLHAIRTASTSGATLTIFPRRVTRWI